MNQLQFKEPPPFWLQGILLYVLCFGILSILIFAVPGFLGNDDYYHARMAVQMMEQQRLAVEFPWLPKTILNPQGYVDHHLLYHLYIAPLTYVAGIQGAKLATVSIAAGVFVAVWALLRQLGTRYAALWTLALFGLSTPFIYRMLMIRTQGASLLLLLLALHLLFQRRYYWLIGLAFAYTWLYNGFALLLSLAALYTIAQWIADKRLELEPLGYTMFGIALGLLINPYFPKNLVFFIEHLDAKLNIESDVRVGNEWYPYSTSVLLANSGGALLVFVLGVLRSSFGIHRRDQVENTLLFVALLTLFMVLRSRRFIEYFPAFALLFCAASWGRACVAITNMQLRRLIGIGGLATLLLFTSVTLGDAYQSIQDAESPDYMAGAANWLQQNTPEGTFVFQTDWDDFPYLFYYNTKNTYLVGLDPTFLERANPPLWKKWVDITQGLVIQPSQVIQTFFGASYVVSDRQHDEFEDRARHDPNMRIVYNDRYSYIWRISANN